MAEIKVSIMEDANGISDDDLLYIVKKTGDSEYESRKTTVREFKSGMEEEIIDKMMETIGGSDDIQYSYRNGWLDWNNAFNISLTSNTQTFTLPMDAHVTSQDTRVN